MEKICEVCVAEYLRRLIELERIVSCWKEFNNIELLFALGETVNEENLTHISVAREKL